MSNEIILQTNLNEYDHVEKQIERSKIKRYPYKDYLGESLSSYCYRCFGMGLSSSQTIAGLLKEDGIRNLIVNYKEENNILKNINISVCARFTEWNRFN